MALTSVSIHILKVTSLFLERAATVALAVLIFRLHTKMAEAENLEFMKEEIKTERGHTIVVLIMLILAFILTLILEFGAL